MARGSQGEANGWSRIGCAEGFALLMRAAPFPWSSPRQGLKQLEGAWDAGPLKGRGKQRRAAQRPHARRLVDRSAPHHRVCCRRSPRPVTGIRIAARTLTTAGPAPGLPELCRSAERAGLLGPASGHPLAGLCRHEPPSLWVAFPRAAGADPHPATTTPRESAPRWVRTAGIWHRLGG